MRAALQAVCAAALLLVSACGGGGGEALPQAHAAAPQRLVVVFGDSLTAGTMPVDGWVQTRQDMAWTAEVSAAGATVVTAAVGGHSTAEAAAIQLPWLRGLPASHVVVLLGTNDAARGLGIEQSLKNVTTLLDAFPGARPVLVAPPLWSESTRAWQTEWRDRLSLLALMRGGVLVDAYSGASPDWWCHADRHPCAAGQRAIGAMVAASL